MPSFGWFIFESQCFRFEKKNSKKSGHSIRNSTIIELWSDGKKQKSVNSNLKIRKNLRHFFHKQLKCITLVTVVVVVRLSILSRCFFSPILFYIFIISSTENSLNYTCDGITQKSDNIEYHKPSVCLSKRILFFPLKRIPFLLYFALNFI